MKNKENENFMLSKILDEDMSQGAYNLRVDGKAVTRQNTEFVQILPKQDGSGIEVFIKENCKNQSVYIPVLVMKGGLNDKVFNDFYVGENAEVVIVAGCGIHNHTNHNSSHNGIHTFYIEKNAKVTYIEKHYGHGEKLGKKNLSPVTTVFLKENASLTMNSVQMEGVDYAVRKTIGKLEKGAKFVVNEKILTEKDQFADSIFEVELNGENASTKISSRAVAKEMSKQEFHSNVIGNDECFGHIECDAILMNDAKIIAVPQISALSSNANLVHEATIGKIAGAQLDKLLTLGLSQSQAEDFIIKGFLS